MGMKTMPIIKKDKITGRGVRIGCQAFKRCCLNAVFPGRLDCEELSREDLLIENHKRTVMEREKILLGEEDG
jgi:hypothetical protein